MSMVRYLRPSGAATWTVCQGYVAMCAAYPDTPDEADNEVREDGTACHWLAHEEWEGRTHAEGSMSPNNRVITDEMHDAVELYLGSLRKVTDAEWYVERPVSCEAIYPGMMGTPDAWSYRPGVLRVRDLKYGFKFVEVWFNWQLIAYAYSLAFNAKLPDSDLVELQIIQPRNFHRDGPVRTWTTTVGAIRELGAKLRESAVKAMSPIRVYTPSPGCADCPGRHACPALQATAYQAIEFAYNGSPLELKPDQIGRELGWLRDAAKRIEARLTGLETQAEHLMRDGAVVPGWLLAPTFARESWTGEEQAIRIADAFNVDIRKPVRAMTPAQARKKLPQIAQPALAALYHKPSTGVRLTKQNELDVLKAFTKQPTLE